MPKRVSVNRIKKATFIPLREVVQHYNELHVRSRQASLPEFVRYIKRCNAKDNADTAELIHRAKEDA